MKLIEILRKLGILRFGAKTGTYTNAKDRPTEFQMNGVFNAEKDLASNSAAKKPAQGEHL